MRFSLRSSSSVWIAVSLSAFGFLFWLTNARLHRVDYATNLVPTELTADPASPTGYTGGLRQLIAPEHNNDSYQWILQTQDMLAHRDWRVRHVSYDNAPVGRTVLTPSPYRWWLGLVAEGDHLISGRPLGSAAENAARIADPLLQALLLFAAVIFVAWQFGIAPAGLLSVALVTIFPLASAFLPGQPSDDGLVRFFALWSVLLLLTGIHARRHNSSLPNGNPPTLDRAIPWFLAGGVSAGTGLWVDVDRTIPILAGIVFGGIVAAWAARRGTKSGSPAAAHAALPWRHWALGGAAASLAGYLLEYSPDYLGTLQLRENHPLYGLAWLGIGELLFRITACLQERAPYKNWRTAAAVIAALVPVVSVLVLVPMTQSRDLLVIDPNSIRLTNLIDGPVARNLWTWIFRDGITLALAATLSPVLLLVPAVWLFRRRETDWSSRAMLALGLAPAFVALGFACFLLRGWNALDAVLLALLIVLTSTLNRPGVAKLRQSLCVIGVLVPLAPGTLLLVEKALADRHDTATEGDVAALIERDLAHWLARQAGSGGAVVLAPPNLTTSLIYHGGLFGLGTPFLENRDGSIASMRIAGASSADEAQAVARGRNLSYIVVPSWENILDEYARIGAVQEEHTLMASLHRWLPPRWLRPVPYHLPAVAGFEGQSVAIFQVVEVQDNATALSHLAEYFVEMEMLQKAVNVASALEHSFPADLGVAVARALVAHAAGDATAFGNALKDVQAGIARGDGESLLWDRRVSLAIALVEGKQFDLAREQVRRCMAEMDEPLLRSLTTVSLHRLQIMTRGFGMEFGNAHLRALAQQLLPAELRDHR